MHHRQTKYTGRVVKKHDGLIEELYYLLNISYKKARIEEILKNQYMKDDC